MTGFQFPTGAMTGFFLLFATASRPALGLTQLLSYGYEWLFCRGKAVGAWS